MKKILLLLIVSIYSLVSSQTDSVDIKYNQYLKEYKDLKIYNKEIEVAIKCIKDFPEEYGKILKLEDFTNIPVQRAIVSDFSKECTQTLNHKDYSGNHFKIGFSNKDAMEKYMVLADKIMKGVTSIKILELSINEEDKYRKEVDVYVRKNLTRLKMPYSEFEKLSPNDKELLFKTFK